MDCWNYLCNLFLGVTMGFNEFSVYSDRDTYTIYKWTNKLRNKTSSAFKYVSKMELNIYLKLLREAPRALPGFVTMTFYNAEGFVVTLVPKDLTGLLENDVHYLYNDLIDEDYLWLDIPELFPINESHSSSWFGLGQLIMLSMDKLVTPIIKSSVIYDSVICNNMERFDVCSFDTYDSIMENLYLRLRLMYRMLDYPNFDALKAMLDIDLDMDKVCNITTCDKSVKYCIQSMSVILSEFAEVEVSFLRRKLYSVNVANFGMSYPIEYDIVQVGKNYQLLYFIYEDKGVRRRSVFDG